MLCLGCPWVLDEFTQKTLILPLTYHNKDISLICKITGMMTTLNIDHGVEIFEK